MREVEHLYCGDCKFFRVDADRHESFCKRIDHKQVRFAIPYFKCYDCNQSAGIICSDFVPATQYKQIVKEWKGFDEYWNNYVDQWLPYGNTDTTVGFTLNGDNKVRYYVKLMDFVNGTMFSQGGMLKWVYKRYYKQDRNPKGFGYTLVTISNADR